LSGFDTESRESQRNRKHPNLRRGRSKLRIALNDADASLHRTTSAYPAAISCLPGGVDREKMKEI
jgi:hypothetical protein